MIACVEKGELMNDPKDDIYPADIYPAEGDPGRLVMEQQVGKHPHTVMRMVQSESRQRVRPPCEATAQAGCLPVHAHSMQAGLSPPFSRAAAPRALGSLATPGLPVCMARCGQGWRRGPAEVQRHTSRLARLPVRLRAGGRRAGLSVG